MKYKSDNAWDTISLHDCNVSQIEVTENVCCYFYGGFWVTPNNHFSQSNKTVRSDRTSLVKVYGMSNVQTKWTQADRKEEFEFQKQFCNADLTRMLLKSVNYNDWRVEIVTQTVSKNDMEIGAYIYIDTPPYTTALTISFTFDKLEYMWNDFNFDATF